MNFCPIEEADCWPRKRGLPLSHSLELKSFVDVLADDRTVSAAKQVHVTHRALGGFASAAHILLGADALEVDVPAVEFALSHD